MCGRWRSPRRAPSARRISWGRWRWASCGQRCGLRAAVRAAVRARRGFPRHLTWASLCRFLRLPQVWPWSELIPWFKQDMRVRVSGLYTTRSHGARGSLWRVVLCCLQASSQETAAHRCMLAAPTDGPPAACHCRRLHCLAQLHLTRQPHLLVERSAQQLRRAGGSGRSSGSGAVADPPLLQCMASTPPALYRLPTSLAAAVVPAAWLAPPAMCAMPCGRSLASSLRSTLPTAHSSCRCSLPLMTAVSCCCCADARDSALPSSCSVDAA